MTRVSFVVRSRGRRWRQSVTVDTHSTATAERIARAAIKKWFPAARLRMVGAWSPSKFEPAAKYVARDDREAIA